MRRHFDTLQPRAALFIGTFSLLLLILGGCEIHRPNTSTSTEPLAIPPILPAQCSETTMVGVASNAYADRAGCRSDEGELRQAAIDDGEEQCRQSCRRMGCDPQHSPQTFSTLVLCADRNPNTAKSYGTATTRAFICRCIVPQ